MIRVPDARLKPPPLARCQPGPRPAPRPAWAKGSGCSENCERHSEAPPDMLVSTSTCSAGSSAMKRDGIDDVHWPYIRRFAARSEERRVGKGGVSTCELGGSPK